MCWVRCRPWEHGAEWDSCGLPKLSLVRDREDEVTAQELDNQNWGGSRGCRDQSKGR